MDYVRLRAAIQEYSEDFEASFVDNVDTFIRLAESRILLRVRLPNFRNDVIGSILQGEKLMAVPTDFLAPDSLSLIEVVFTGEPRRSTLVNKDPEFLRECYPTDQWGPPRFYAMVNERSLLIGPPADADYRVEMGYFFEPPSIVDQTAGTWLGSHFAHALLSGALVEACTYMKTEDSLYMRYSQAFEKDLAMDREYAKGRTKKDTYQEPDVRAKV